MQQRKQFLSKFFEIYFKTYQTVQIRKTVCFRNSILQEPVVSCPAKRPAVLMLLRACDQNLLGRDQYLT